MKKDSASETAEFIETEIDSGCQGPGVEVAQEDAREGGPHLSCAARPCPDLQYGGPDPMMY